MATTTKVTSASVLFFYGTEGAYTAATGDTLAAFKQGVYICDNGKLYVHGTEVKQADAFTAAEFDKNYGKIKFTKTDGTTKEMQVDVMQLGDVMNEIQGETVDTRTGLVSVELMAQILGGIPAGLSIDNSGNINATYVKGSNNKAIGKVSVVTAASGSTAGIVTGSTLKAIKDNADAAKTALDGFNADVKTALTKAPNQNGGVVVVGSDTKIPASVLPSYVDDVVNFDGTVTGITATAGPIIASGVTKFYYDTTGKRFVATNDSGKTYVTTWVGSLLQNVPTASTPEAGKIYVDTTKNTTYRWGGTDLVQIKGDLTIGTTAGTAYDGAAGKALEGKVNSLATSESNDKITAISYNAKTQKLTLTKGSGTIVQGNTFPAVDGTNPGLMTVAQKGQLEGAYTGTTTVTSGAKDVSITPNRVDGKAGTVFKIPEASADGSGTAGVVSGQTAKAIVANTADRVNNFQKTQTAADKVTLTIDRNTAADLTVDLAAATTTVAGVMSAADKTLLDASCHWWQATVE